MDSPEQFPDSPEQFSASVPVAAEQHASGPLAPAVYTLIILYSGSTLIAVGAPDALWATEADPQLSVSLVGGGTACVPVAEVASMFLRRRARPGNDDAAVTNSVLLSAGNACRPAAGVRVPPRLARALWMVPVRALPGADVHTPPCVRPSARVLTRMARGRCGARLTQNAHLVQPGVGGAFWDIASRLEEPRMV